MLSKQVSSKRVDRVHIDTLRATRAVNRANEAIRQLEADNVLRTRLRLIERRQEREEL